MSRMARRLLFQSTLDRAWTKRSGGRKALGLEVGERGLGFPAASRSRVMCMMCVCVFVCKCVL